MAKKASKKVIVEYNGWIELHPETVFDYIGSEDKDSITAAEYAKLDGSERENYMLQCFGDACNEAVDGSNETFDRLAE